MFLIFLIGFLVIPVAAVVEVRHAPPFWLHALLWPAMILALALILLRPSKALLVAFQFRYRREDFEGDRPAHGP